MSTLAICAPTLSPLLERRGAERHRCQRVCYAQPNGTALGVSWGATLLNLSRYGAMLELRQPLTVDTILAVQLAGDGSTDPLLARVVRVQPLGESWFCGCELLEPLHPEQLQDWLS